MICTGSWDAGSLFMQAKKVGFEVGIFDFPLPARGEHFGEFVNGKATEASSGGSAASDSTSSAATSTNPSTSFSS